MKIFLEELRQQRWDDHRYCHHSRINQSLHLLSAVNFWSLTAGCWSTRRWLPSWPGVCR